MSDQRMVNSDINESKLVGSGIKKRKKHNREYIKITNIGSYTNMNESISPPFMRFIAHLAVGGLSLKCQIKQSIILTEGGVLVLVSYSVSGAMSTRSLCVILATCSRM